MKSIVEFLMMIFITLGVDMSSLETKIVSTSQQVSDIVTHEFAFKELTIPYLSSRIYSSEILETKINRTTPLYDEYLTSYTSDNLKINGLLTIPNSDVPEGGFPAIVFIHGYIPPNEYKTTEKYVAYVDYLSRSGFVVFKIDLRGHGQSEGEATGAYYSGDYVVDALNAYEALKKLENVNPKKVGLWGHSMAGNVTLRSIAIKKDIPAAVVWAGAGFTYTDFLEYGIGDNSYQPPNPNSERARRRRELVDMYGQFDPNSWFWKQITPINYLDGVKTKIQLHHSINDDVVNVAYSQNLKKLLDEKSIENEYHEYKLGGHNITSPSFTPAMQKTVEFFKNNLN